ncbi:MAG: ribosome small subunit-dependent GTPase A [Gemmatimonadota bacterium]|nr:ribosome small subunit-dependent GTPase A [Gemmatimonadota bacterium]
MVELDDGRRVEATLRGRLKRRPDEAAQAVIGDRVRVAPSDEAWTVEGVEPRRTALVRRGRGGRSGKVLAANLDRVLAVVAFGEPEATPELIDRLLALVEASGMRPVLVVNKVDLAKDAADVGALTELYGGLGYDVLAVSAVTGESMDTLRALCASGASALVGPSGVGKSSLLNTLEPGLSLKVGALSGKTSTGRHTTVGSRLIRLASGGLVADTPGFSDVALWGIAPEDVEICFPEIHAMGAACRFRSCTHRHEPDCAVLEAVEEGRIPESRYGSYVTLREDAEGMAEY